MTIELSGRVEVYTNQVPYETDVLRTNNYNMSGVAGLSSTVLGFGVSNQTMVRGLACVPISPPGLSVVVGPGVMYSYVNYDATNYGVIPADTNPNHNLYKQFFIWDPVNLSVPAPSTPGDSIIYLIEGIHETIDVNNISRPYFNSADPSIPIFNNNYDTRYDTIILAAKPGAPAPSPTPPAPDAGYTGLYHVTVANGQSSIISGNIVKVSVTEGQPFITESLVQKVSSATVAAGYVSIGNQQQSAYVSATDVGSINSVVLNPTNAYASYGFGTTITFLAANTNSGPTIANINGLGSKNIVIGSPLGPLSLNGGEIVAGNVYDLFYTGTSLELKNPSVPRCFYGHATASGTQTIPMGFVNKIIFGGTLDDPYSWWDPTNNRFTPTIPGQFLIITASEITSTVGTETSAYLNGSSYELIGSAIAASSIGSWGCSTQILLNGKTDYVEIWSGSSVAAVTTNGGVNTFFKIIYLGN